MDLYKSNELREQIAKGLAHLQLIVNDNEQKVKEIVTTFISDTPATFKLIEERIANKDLLGAAALVHKVKVRYGYLGLNDIFAELSEWEEHLAGPIEILNNYMIIEKFTSLNSQIISDLMQTPYSQLLDYKEKPVLDGKSVLIAEDDEVNVMVFELFVKELGASVRVATNGNEALQMAMDKKPDLIFMDVHMPFLSGLEVIKAMRGMGCTCPIVSLSASTRLNERQNSLDAGANEFLVKPASRQAINSVLLKYLG